MSLYDTDPAYPEMYTVAKHRVANDYSEAVLNAWHGWHTDLTAAVNPPAASILRGDVVPPYGGDTMWADSVSSRLIEGEPIPSV